MICNEEGRWAWREGETGTIQFENILDDEGKLNKMQETHSPSIVSSESNTPITLNAQFTFFKQHILNLTKFMRRGSSKEVQILAGYI